MKMKIKDTFLIAKVTKGEKSVFVLLGDKEFKGNYGVFVDEKLVEGLEPLDKVEVEMTLTITNKREVKNGKAEFLNVISNTKVDSIKKV